jgi:CubicO group peptidase (beta-lactamase class C family)
MKWPSLFISTCLYLTCLTAIFCASGERANAAESAATAGGEKANKPDDDNYFADGDAQAEGISEEALGKLVQRAGETHSNALVIIKNGKLIGQWYFGHVVKAHPLNSITKSISALAIGKMLDDKKLAAIDVPVASVCPPWRTGAKSAITLKHVLTQTTGLDEAGEVNMGDVVADALAAKIKEAPGARFIYNNRASNLILPLAKAACGQNLDQYVNTNFFTPLQITSWQWHKDEAGQAPSMGGLDLSAIDLAKFGQLLVDGGTVKQKRLLSAAFIHDATATPGMPKASADYGYMFWLLDKGHAGFMGRGNDGQYLLVLPNKKLIVVRQISQKGHKSEADDFADLPEIAQKLTAGPAP